MRAGRNSDPRLTAPGHYAKINEFARHELLPTRWVWHLGTSVLGLLA